jgi:hypothetical protein
MKIYNMNYIVYKIINKINDKIYIGCHKTENINDDYMGSGKLIKKAIEKYGLENFNKLVLYNFDNKSDMLKKEAELVNREFIKRNDVYNLIEGGLFSTIGFARVKDKNNKGMLVSINDPRYLSGELKGITSGKVMIKDKNDNIFLVSKEDSRYLSGELKSIHAGMINAKDKNGNIYRISNTDSRYLSGELKSIFEGKVTVKDINGNYYKVSTDDPRIHTGELVGHWKGRKHSEKTKEKMRSHKGKNSGEKGALYNKCWIYNIQLKENKAINKIDLNNWIESGWVKGRKMKF